MASSSIESVDMVIGSVLKDEFAESNVPGETVNGSNSWDGVPPEGNDESEMECNCIEGSRRPSCIVKVDEEDAMVKAERFLFFLMKCTECKDIFKMRKG